MASTMEQFLALNLKKIHEDKTKENYKDDEYEFHKGIPFQSFLNTKKINENI